VPGLPPERYPELGLRYRHHYLAAEHELALFEGSLAMLADLKARHHWLAVATGKNRAGLDRVLAAQEMQGLFDATRTADETRSKPHPQMLLELMREFGVEPERTLKIGDTTHDLLLARNAGAASVGVSFGAHDHETFAELAPRFVAHSTAELHRWLLAHA
jgi:phosphoglycolate phosphatase